MADSMQSGHWSRRRTLAVSGAALLLLYIGLLWATGGRATAAPTLAQQSAPPPQPTSQATPEGKGESLSPTLLAEFDRLASNNDEAATDSFGESEQTTSGVVSTMTLSLLLIVGAIYAGVWLYKRQTASGPAGGLLLGGRLLAVQESQTIGPNQKLHLVRMGDELLLIGATEQNISFLARYDGEVADSSFAGHLQSATLPGSPVTNSGLDLNEGLQRLRELGRSTLRGGGGDD